MSKLSILTIAAALLAAAPPVGAGERHERDLAVVMTNDSAVNVLKVYDAQTGILLQTLPTHGRGGAGGNARGVRQFDGGLVAAVNYGSGSVALFKRSGDRLRFDTLVTTTSAPVSVDFGNGHMYVSGLTTVDSFVLHGGNVEWRRLELKGLDGDRDLPSGDPLPGDLVPGGIGPRGCRLERLAF